MKIQMKSDYEVQKGSVPVVEILELTQRNCIFIEDVTVEFEDGTTQLFEQGDEIFLGRFNEEFSWKEEDIGGVSYLFSIEILDELKNSLRFSENFYRNLDEDLSDEESGSLSERIEENHLPTISLNETYKKIKAIVNRN